MTEMRLGRTNHGLTEYVHRILCGAHFARLNRAGIKTRKVSDIPGEFFLNRATRDYLDLPTDSEEGLRAEQRGETASCSLDLNPEFALGTFGIDGKEFHARSKALDVEREQRAKTSGRNVDAGKRDPGAWIDSLSMDGLEGRQMAALRRVQDQRREMQLRALDPATDTALVGTDYLHEPAREMLAASDLLSLFPSVDIPAGYRSLQISNLADARFVKTAATTTDAYGFNTAEDPTSGSQTWTPVKLMAIIPWNGEFEDDSLFKVEAALRGSMDRGLTLAMLQALLFGDTTNTAGANINASGGSLALGTKDPRLLWNGIFGDFYRSTAGGKSADTFTGGIDGGGDAMTVTDVYDLIKDLGKFGVPQQASNLFLACSAQSFYNVRSDALGKYQMNILDKDIFGLNWIVQGNAAPTHASASNVPTDALNLWDGVPTNRNASGVYDNTTKTRAVAALWNRINYLVAKKRSYSLKVVDIEPVDLKAIVGTIRLDFKPILTNLTSSTVGFNLL